MGCGAGQHIGVVTSTESVSVSWSGIQIAAILVNVV